ncbi:MAG TPA: hypothetical protein VM012_03855, partial [Flavitalea sp.]|nr:hypothetical protein [Flavitalea sp.]
MSVDKITIKGIKRTAISPPGETSVLLALQDSLTVGAATRGLSQTHTYQLQENHIVEFVFEDDTTWICSKHSIEDVFPEATASTRSADGFEIPISIRNDTERGLVSGVILKVVNIFVKKSIASKVKSFAAELEQKQLDHAPGLFGVDKDFSLQKFAGNPDHPSLLFLHGTNSSTKGSFGSMLGLPLWKYILQTYGSNILAFQHESLTKSPLTNTLELATQLPSNCTVDIISHSRGGLIGDVLSRFSTPDENNRGFSKPEKDLLLKSGRTEDVEIINSLEKLFRKKRITIRKFIRVACPASGTILASRRLDHFFNISLNLLGVGLGMVMNPIFTAFKNLVVSTIDLKNDAGVLPGIEAMNPDSPFIKVLNNPGNSIGIENPLIVISGNCNAKLNLKALLIIASKLFYRKDNDLVVNTRSMYQGTKRI